MAGRGTIDGRQGGRRTGGIFGAYGPDSESWRLSREATLLLAAGPRALLLQLAHPLVAEGVAQHSAFREDPWSRLRGTLRSYLRIVFGTELQAAQEIARLNRLHERVRGPVNDPLARRRTRARSYSALDPALELWVHATLVDSTMVAYDAWIEPLGEARQAAYYAETRSIGLGFGIPAEMLPADLAAFRRYLGSMLGSDGPVGVTPTARELATTILHPPLGPIVRSLDQAGDGARAARSRTAAAGSTQPPGGGAGPATVARILDAIPVRAYDWLMWPAVELLPEPVREGYGIPQTIDRRLVTAWLVRTFGLWRSILPERVRWMPQAVAAERRLALGAGDGPRETTESGRGDGSPERLHLDDVPPTRVGGKG